MNLEKQNANVGITFFIIVKSANADERKSSLIFFSATLDDRKLLIVEFFQTLNVWNEY